MLPLFCKALDEHIHEQCHHWWQVGASSILAPNDITEARASFARAIVCRMALPTGPAEDQKLTVVKKDVAGRPHVREVMSVRFGLLETVR